MSNASEARRQRRAMKRAGVALVERVSIDHAAIMAAMDKGAKPLDLIAFHVAEVIEILDQRGAQIIGGQVAITIGEHPDHLGAVTIEGKAASLRPTVDPDPGCPIDHSLDVSDED